MGAAQSSDSTTFPTSNNATVTLEMRKRNDATGVYEVVPPGTKVSGTNVNLEFSVTVKGTSDPDGPTKWNRARVQPFEVASQGVSPALDSVKTIDLVDPPPPGGGAFAAMEDVPGADPEAEAPQTPVGGVEKIFVGGSTPVRIASTEFPDGGTIAFTVTAKVRFWRHDDASNVDTLVTDQTFALNPSLTACNRVILLATNEEWNGSAYVTNPIAPTQPLYKNTAAAAMPLVRPFWTTAHHTIFPDAGKETKWGENASVGDTIWRTQNLDAEMKKYTALFAFTHGETTSPPHFRASVGPYTVTDGQVYGSEIGAYAYSGRTIPDTYQIAIFYSCSLGGSTSLPNGFHIDQLAQKWKGLAGFGYQCYYLLSHPNDVALDQHAKKLMDYLSQGLPLAVALDQLQSSYTGHDNIVPANASTKGPMLMNSNGSYARLRYVYLEANIFDPLYSSTDPNVRNSVNTWYWLF